MKRMFSLGLLVIGLSNSSNAQFNRFIKSGIIEYDKNVNMFAVLPRIVRNSQTAQQDFEQYKKNQPQFLVLKSTMTFARNKTLYEPIPGPSTNSFNTNPVVTQNNIVFNDLTSGEVVTQKNLFGNYYLVKDKIKKIKWKITDETRDVAGFPCRRANGITSDSIYIVAFYTSKIPVSGGPESFSGLPGMILQAAIPRENISWLATRVTDKPIATVTPPSKGAPITLLELKEELRSSLARFGETAQVYLKAFLYW